MCSTEHRLRSVGHHETAPQSPKENARFRLTCPFPNVCFRPTIRAMVARAVDLDEAMKNRPETIQPNEHGVALFQAMLIDGSYPLLDRDRRPPPR